MSYSVSFENREHHELTVHALFSDLGSQPLELRMSRTSPGRYRLHEFAKNLYGLKAKDALGEELVVEATSPSGWRIADHHGTVEVSYTLFGDLLSGTYSAIESRFSVLNPPATFIWAKGLEDRRIEVNFDLPLGWIVVSQLEEVKIEQVAAPNLAYFLDSPIGLGSFDDRTWQVDRNGRVLPGPEDPGQNGQELAEDEVGVEEDSEKVEKEEVEEEEVEGSSDGAQSFRLAVHHEGATDSVDRYQKSVEKLVAEASAVFGELPNFDRGRYTIIANYLPYAHNDAMEHRNSTVHSAPDSFETAQSALLHTLIHEFFHVWNVERIRPAALEPFDFEALNPSEELWFAEGFTNYYDGLLMVRAGVRTEAEFLAEVTKTLDSFVNSTARRFGGAAYMSSRAAFNDRAAWVDPRNKVNTYLHYYYYGDALALALDLELRNRFDSDLDQFMRLVWDRHGRNEKPYVNADLEELLKELTTGEFAAEFFENYVESGGEPNFEALLESVGLTFHRPGAGRPWLGFASLGVDGDGVYVKEPTRFGTPLYEAGLGQGDRILELGDRKLEAIDDVAKALRRKKPGGTIRIVSERRKEWREGILTLGEDPTVEVVIDEPRQTNESVAARAGWLSTKVGS